MDDMKLVLVEWEDSFGCASDWERLDGCKPQVQTCRSVGWMLYNGDDCKVIVPHVAPKSGHGCGDMTIPTRAIVRIAELAEAAT